MKKTVVNTIFLLLFVGVALSVSAQSWNNRYAFHLTYPGLLKTDPVFASAFRQLAYNNSVSVLGLHLDLSYRARFSLTQSAAGIPLLRYKVVPEKISGSTRFRDFRVDTLLIPQMVEVVLRVYQNHHLRDVLHQKIFAGREQVLVPVSHKVPLDSLYITLQVLQPVFTNDNYRRFLRTAAEINHYYGYGSLFAELPHLLQKLPDNQPAPSSVYLNYLVLARLSGYVLSHQFSKRLHLNKKDPLHFRRHFAAVLRKKTRMHTLSEEAITGTGPANETDKNAFARGYAAISMKAIALAKQHQPFVAASFTEFSRVYPGADELGFIHRVSARYDMQNKPGKATVPLAIYKDFLDAASMYIRQKAYVSALTLLSNAVYFEKGFTGVTRLPEFDTLLLKARDGLAFSYIKVASIAMQHKDGQWTAGYLSQALQSIHPPAGRGSIPPPDKRLCYSRTATGFDSLALFFRDKNQPEQALQMLQYADSACPDLPKTRQLTVEVCRLWLHDKFESIRVLLENGQPENACNRLLNTADNLPFLCYNTRDTVRNKQLREKASEIIHAFLSQTAGVLQQGDIQTTMKLLERTTRLQKKFSLSPLPLYDSLIRRSTLPYLFSLVEKTRLEIWRKDFRRADSLMGVIGKISRQYAVEKNARLSLTLKNLSQNLDSAYCQWQQQQIRYFLQQSDRAVKADRISLAESYYLKAKGISDTLSACPRSTPDTLRRLLSQYTRMFRFAHDVRMLTRQLFQKGFTAVIPEYAMLDLRFRKDHLEKQGFPFTPLFTFVQNQHSDPMTLSVVRFFIRVRRFSEAFRYLQLLSNPEVAKTEQKQIAQAYARQHIVPPGSFLQNPAFSAFKKSYEKTLETTVK